MILLTLLKVSHGELPLSKAASAVKSIVPKDFNPLIKQSLEHACLPYFQLAEAFLNRSNTAVFENDLAIKEEKYKADKNFGLVK